MSRASSPWIRAWIGLAGVMACGTLSTKATPKNYRFIRTFRYSGAGTSWVAGPRPAMTPGGHVAVG
ncbi:MAG: hypothetical protein ABSC06_03810, partial [Rhodopila sp.]